MSWDTLGDFRGWNHPLGWENPGPGSLFKLKQPKVRRNHPNFPKPHEVGALGGRAPGFFTYRHRFLVSFQIVEGGKRIPPKIAEQIPGSPGEAPPLLLAVIRFVFG